MGKFYKKGLVFIVLFSIMMISCKQEKIEVKLHAFETSECRKDIEYDQQGEMAISTSKDGNLTVSVYGVGNCCSEFQPLFEIKNDTIHLGFSEGGRICSCFCCYDFVYEIEGIKDVSNYTFNYTNRIIEIVEIEEIPEE